MSATPEYGFTLATSQFGEVYVPELNRNYFEASDSASLFAEKYPELLSKADTLHLVVGTDSGLLLQHVLKGELPAGSRYLFVEHQDVIAFLQLAVPEELQDRVELLPETEFSDVFASGRYDVYLIRHCHSLTRAEAAVQAYFEPYNRLKTDVIKQRDYVLSLFFTNLNQNKFYEQQLLNVADNQYSASLLKQHLPGNSCIVVGGAPSLDTHLEWLRENQHRLVVIAVSRVAYKLHLAGIHPDIVVSVDPYEISFRVCKQMLELPSSVIFVNGYHVVHQLLSQWSGTKFYLGAQYPWQTEENISAPGPTVSNASLGLAAGLGFEQVLLLGVDLCSAPSGVTHAKGTWESKLGPDINTIGEWVETYAGEMAETPMQFHAAVRALEYQAAQYQQCEIVNLAQHAAKVPGIAWQHPDAIVLPDAIDKQAFQAEIHALYGSQPSSQWLQEVRGELTEMLKQCRKVELKSARALELTEGFPNTQAKIDRLEEDMRTAQAQAMRMVQVLGIRAVSGFMTGKKDDELSADELKQQQQLYYQAMVGSAPVAISMLKDGLAIVDSRILELEPRGKLQQLQQAWLSQNSPRRGELLGRYHGLDSEQSTLQALKQAFVALMNEQPKPASSDREKMTRWPLTNVADKIHLLYSSQNPTGLKQVIYGLENFQVSDEARRLCARARSYLAELNGEKQAAVEAILDLPPELRQETDKRQLVKAAIGNGQVDVAIDTLYQLIELSDTYLPLLAKALKYKRDYLGAVEAWLLYLNKHQQDVDSWCHLGDLLTEAGALQDAMQIYQQALALNPGYPRAHQGIQKLSLMSA